MALIGINEKGRIYVNQFQVEKNVYLFIRKFYPELNCYCVEYKNNVLNVYVENIDDLGFVHINILREEAIKYFQKGMGIYIKKINFHIR